MKKFVDFESFNNLQKKYQMILVTAPLLGILIAIPVIVEVSIFLVAYYDLDTHVAVRDQENGWAWTAAALSSFAVLTFMGFFVATLLLAFPLMFLGNVSYLRAVKAFISSDYPDQWKT